MSKDIAGPVLMNIQSIVNVNSPKMSNKTHLSKTVNLKRDVLDNFLNDSHNNVQESLIIKDEN